MLVCFLVSFVSFFVKFLKGKDSLRRASLFFLGDKSHLLAHNFFIWALYSCLTAEVLLGSGTLRMWGRAAEALEWPSAAFFANWSTYSLPATSLWLKIHLIVSMHVDEFAALRRACTKYCPDDMLGDQSNRIINWLSKYKVTFLPVVSAVFSSIHSASNAPAAYASNVLWSLLLLRYFCRDLIGWLRCLVAGCSCSPVLY